MDNMPKGSMPMANLMFQVFSMLIYSVVILFIISLQIHTNEGKKPVPDKVQKIFHFLSLACLRNRKIAISSVDSALQNEKRNSLSSTEVKRFDAKRLSPQRYCSGYLTEEKSSPLKKKEEARSHSEVCPAYPSSYDSCMTWTYVGNVFDAYMLLLFGLSFGIITTYFSV